MLRSVKNLKMQRLTLVLKDFSYLETEPQLVSLKLRKDLLIIAGNCLKKVNVYPFYSFLLSRCPFSFSLARETEKCIKDYSRRCLAAFPRQVTNLLVFGIANQQKKYCKKGGSAIVQHGKCGNSDLEKGHKCMDTYIDHLYGIQESEDANKKIPYVCW